MAFDLAAAKAVARRVVHDTMSLDAIVEHRTLPAPTALRVRYHGKQSVIGDLQSEGYPMMIDGIDRVIFDTEELLLKGVVVERGFKITITSKGWNNAVLAVDTQDKSEGPIEEIWRVTKV